MPFQSPNFTQVPNDFFDEFLPELDKAELKVLLVVIRGTFGYHRNEVEISSREMAEQTGLSLASIGPAAETLETMGLIEKITDGGKTTRWRACVTDSIIGTRKKKGVSMVDTVVIQPLVQGVSTIESQVGLNKDKENKINDSDKVINFMFSIGMFPNSMTGDLLKTWREKHTDDWIIKALETAKGKSQSYADKVLIGWEANGYPKTREQLIEERKAAKPAHKPQAEKRIGPAIRSLD